MDLIIPDYQRPYKWSAKNIHDLIFDIQKSIEDSSKFPNFKYRVGTIILHINDQNEYEIVDGQQRVLSLLLLELYLEQDLSCKLLDATFSDPITQRNLHDNYVAICEWFSSCDENIKSRFKGALKNILEVVIITVDKIGEAFQLFDSQNSRGRALYPHDLLKAYHLREIHDKYEMKDAVLKWESKKPEAIRELFDLYLFPLWNWAKCRKCGSFTSADIDIYKGIDEASGYNYARRANKAMPYFILTEPFISGSDFFEMVEHYMTMLHNIKDEIVTNPLFTDIKMILTNGSEVDTVGKLEYRMKKSSAGLNHAKNLFFCALLCYYDRFHNFDPMAIKKLFSWAMMIRVDMSHLGFATINRYAIGINYYDKYSNAIPMIANISYARRHTEISGIKINLGSDDIKDNKLHLQLKKLNGLD